MHTQTQTRVLTHIRIKESYRIRSWESMGKSWEEEIWKYDQLKMLECYSNGMEVVPGTYKKGSGQAENDKSRIPERESVVMQELKIDASLLDEMLYYGVVV